MPVLTALLFARERAAWEHNDGSIGTRYKAMQAFSPCIDRHRACIPNYGERYRTGERIRPGFVEATVNQVVSKRRVKQQQMRWSQRGAPLLLHMRPRVLQGAWEDVFRRWSPGVRAPTPPVFACACLLRPAAFNPPASAVRGVLLAPEHHHS
jgi:hypothetical protein